MKNLIILAICLATLPVFAQTTTTDQEERAEKLRDNVEALRVAYITRELDLTAEEAQQFWPIYNEMHRRMKEEVHKGRGPHPHGGKKDLSTLSDAELAEMVNERMAQRQAELDLHKEYLIKFRAVLPERKANMVFLLDGKFRQEIMKKYHDRMKGGRDGAPRGLREGGRGDGRGDGPRGLRGGGL